MGACRPGDLLQGAAHGPTGQDPVALILQETDDGGIGAVDGKIQGGQAQDVDAFLLRLFPRLHEPPGQGGEGHGRAPDIGLHARGGEAEGRDAGPVLDEGRHGLIVEAGHGRDGGPGDGDEFGTQVPGGGADVRDQLLVVAQDGFHFTKAGDVDHAVHVVPPGFIVGGVGGIAAGGIVHDGHAPQLEEGRAYAEGVGGKGGNDSRCLFHTQPPQPMPLIWISPRRSFSSRTAS